MNNAEAGPRTEEQASIAYEYAIQAIVATEERAGDITPGDVSGGQVVAMKHVIGEMMLWPEDRVRTVMQLNAMVGLGSFRSDFKKPVK